MAEIHTLSIDIETFSDVDLSKCGVYKYAESDAFEILLFGYAVNSGSVSVVDLASGEEIPLKSLPRSPIRIPPNGHSTQTLSASACPAG